LRCVSHCEADTNALLRASVINDHDRPPKCMYANIRLGRDLLQWSMQNQTRVTQRGNNKSQQTHHPQLRVAPAGYGGGFATSIPASATSPRHLHPPPYPPAGPKLHQTRPVTGTRDPMGTHEQKSTNFITVYLDITYSEYTSISFSNGSIIRSRYSNDQNKNKKT
jgi:hypothetical protein